MTGSNLRLAEKLSTLIKVNEQLKKEQFSIHAHQGLNHWWHYGTKFFFRRLVKKYLPGGSLLLDAGCGVGDMMVLLGNDYRMTGIDSSEDAIMFCSQKGIAGRVIRGDISSLPFTDGYFDGILSLDVLYHQWVPDELQALREMYRVLKPKGRLFIQLPAFEWLRSDHDEWALSRRRYTARELMDLLVAAGFHHNKVGYRVFFLFPVVVVRRLLCKAGGSDMKDMNPFLNTLLKKVVQIENLLAPLMRFPFGLSVFGVAEK